MSIQELKTTFKPFLMVLSSNTILIWILFITACTGYSYDECDCIGMDREALQAMKNNKEKYFEGLDKYCDSNGLSPRQKNFNRTKFEKYERQCFNSKPNVSQSSTKAGSNSGSSTQLSVQYSGLKKENSTLKNEIKMLEARLESQQIEIDELQISLDKLDLGKSLFKDVPFMIVGMDFYTKKSDQRVYTTRFYQEKITYLYPRIKTKRFTENLGTLTLYVRFINPEGTIMSNENSPLGYTYSHDIGYGPLDIFDFMELSGWGSESGGTYDRGTYRVEIWTELFAIGYGEFTVQ